VPGGALDAAELAGLDAFFAGFIEECVDFGHAIFLFMLQRARLRLDGLARVAFVK
jgi:hypothetical protein